MRRVVGSLPLASLTAPGLVSCTEAPFERANAWDPRYELPGQILPAVDSVLSRDSDLQLQLQVADTLVTTGVGWTVICVPMAAAGPCPGLSISTQGLLRVEPTLVPRQLRVVASLGSQQYEREITAVQRAAAWRFQCLPGVDQDCARRGAFDQPLGWMVHYYDANNVCVPLNLARPDSLEPLATYTFTEPGIVVPDNGYLRTGFQNGSTLVIRVQFGRVDTLPFQVAQVVSSVQTSCRDLPVGDTLTLAYTDVRDATGHQIAYTMRERWIAGGYVPEYYQYDRLTRRLTATEPIVVDVVGWLYNADTDEQLFVGTCALSFYAR